MTNDLLTRIQGEMHERLQMLRGAVDTHDRLAADLEALEAEHRPEAGVRQGPALGCEPSGTRVVSPKVMRLMSVPRRPLLERGRRSRAAWVSDGGIDPFPEEGPVDEIDVEVERYEHSI